MDEHIAKTYKHHLADLLIAVICAGTLVALFMGAFEK